MNYIDLSITLNSSTPVYPGDEKPELNATATLEHDGHTNFVLRSGMHVGTHVDGPWHMIPGGKPLSDFTPETFFGSGIVVDARGKEQIDESVLQGAVLERGSILLICTGWSSRYGSEIYYKEYPVLTPEFAQKCVDAGVKMVGLDSPSPDQPPFVVHKILLGASILIIENLVKVEELLGQKFEVIVAPLKVEADSAPARVIAKVI